MNEKRMVEWARKRSQAEPTLTIAEARAQMDERERSEAQKLSDELQRRGLTDPVRLVETLRDEADARRQAAQDAFDALAARENAEDLEFINEWRAEDGLPLLSALSEASLDELEAACEGNSRLLLRRR